MIYFSPLCQLLLSISQNMPVRPVPCFVMFVGVHYIIQKCFSDDNEEEAKKPKKKNKTKQNKTKTKTKTQNKTKQKIPKLALCTMPRPFLFCLYSKYMYVVVLLDIPIVFKQAFNKQLKRVKIF